MLGRPAAQAAVLEKAAAAAEAACAQPEALQSLSAAAASARKRAEDEKPLHQRLAAAEKKLARAQAMQEKADAEAARAVAAAATSRQATDDAKKEFEELRRSVADATPPTDVTDSATITEATRSLLQALELLPLRSADATPGMAPVLAAMANLHGVLGTAQEAQREAAEAAAELINRGDCPASEGGEMDDSGDDEDGVRPDELSETDVMRELDAVPEDDESQLIAVARQLKRARRGAPY